MNEVKTSKERADEVIQGSNVIEVTNKTVRFGSDVYQF